MLRIQITIFIIVLLLEKLCNAMAIEEPSKSLAYTQALAAEPTNTSYTTSYFQSELKGPDTYAFGYEVVDESSGNAQFRDERRHVNGTIEGNYGYLRPDGLITVTHYQADKQLGYQSHLGIYQPNEVHNKPVWAQLWPEIIKNSTQGKTSHKYFSNVTDAAMSAGAQEQQGDDFTAQKELEVRPPDHAALSPIVEDIINGRVPLQLQANENSSSMGFETVENFLPKHFPIDPFELPSRLDDKQKHKQKEDGREIIQDDDNNKDAKSKENSPQKKMWMKSMDPESESFHLKEIQEDPPEGDDQMRRNSDKTRPRTLDSAVLITNGTAKHLSEIINKTRNQFVVN